MQRKSRSMQIRRCFPSNKDPSMFSHKLFISCSILCILYPVVITAGERNAAPPPFNFVKFGSILSQLNCNPSRSTICNSSWPKPFIGKHVRDVTTIVQGLAILVGYAFSLVMSLILLSVFLLRFRVSTNFGLQNLSFDQEIMPIVIVVLIMFQFSTFPCVWQRPRAMRSKPVIVLPYFEKGFIQSVYTETTSIIRLLLFLSGDVELNPGPSPPSDKRSPTEEASSVSLSGYETEHSNGAKDSTEKCSHPEEASSVSLSGYETEHSKNSTEKDSLLCTDSEGSSSQVDTRPSPHTVRVVSSSKKKGSHKKFVRYKKIRKIQSPRKHIPLSFNSREVPPTDFNQILKRRHKKHVPLRSHSDSMCDLDIQNAATKQPSELVLPFQSATLLVDPEDPYLIKLKSRVEGLLEKLKNVNGWNKETGFQSNIESETFTRFYLLVNQLYRAGGECDACLLCGKIKTCKLDSHIFPRCLLKAFSKIHCEGEGNCVYDSSTGECMGANSLTLPLFCISCEKNACHNEQRLRDLYITIMAKGDKHIEITDDQDQWLKKILAILMFRGCLTGINFFGEIQNDFDELMKWLIALRKFILSSDEKISERLALYLLPNGSFNPNNAAPTYIFDFVLRCPSFTSLVRCNDQTFIYTQFDCFHCVLPFYDVERSPIDLPLLKCFNLLPSSETRKQHFPSLLLNVNCWRILEMEIFLLKNPQIKEDCRIVTSRIPNRSAVTPVIPNIRWKIGSIDSDLKDIHKFTTLDSDTQNDYIKIARDLSPLISNTDLKIDNLMKEKKAEKEKSQNFQGKYERKKAEVREEKKVTVKLQEQVKALKKQLIECKLKLKKNVELQCQQDSQTVEELTFGMVPQTPSGMAPNVNGMLNFKLSVP